jgi:hypothetical protein
VNSFPPARSLSPNCLLPFSPTGLVAVCAPHSQIGLPLTQTLVALAKDGQHVAVIVADNHFEADKIARVVPEEQLKVARAETPHQVRQLVRRLSATHTCYSVAVVIGLLEPFYDEQVKWTVARTLLTDTLCLLNELARTLRVLVIITPAPSLTRPYLKDQLTKAVDTYTELPALASAKQALQVRLF